MTTPEQVHTLLKLLNTRYSAWIASQTNKDLEINLKQYETMLGEFDPDILESAILNFIASSENSYRMPTIAEIRSECILLMAVPMPSALAAWRAVCGGNRSIPLATQIFTALGLSSHDLKMMDHATLSVTRSLFCKEYDGAIQRQRKHDLDIPAVRALRDRKSLENLEKSDTVKIAHSLQHKPEERVPLDSGGVRVFKDIIANLMEKLEKNKEEKK